MYVVSLSRSKFKHGVVPPYTYEARLADNYILWLKNSVE